MKKLVRLSTIINLLATYLLSQSLTQSNLPIVVINTDNTIPNEPKITAHMGIIYNGKNQINYISDKFNEYDGLIGIETRGSSSQMFPKKSYSIETRDTDGNNLNVSLLGMPEENDWILYGPYSDKSLIRNALAYKLYEEMGWYSPRFRFCELILNNEYKGLYLLIGKIKRDKNRVDISKLATTDIEGIDITGGYIIKIDKTEGSKTAGWYSQHNIYYQYHYPDPDDILEVQKNYIISFIDSFEYKMNNINYSDQPEEKYKKVNIESFVDVTIISELSKNVDAYRLSFFMYKDRDDKDGRLTAGPIWDYNLAFGNVNYYDAEKYTGWKIIEGIPDDDSFKIPFWWNKMWNDPFFQQKFKQRWRELRNDIISENHILLLIDSLTNYISDAARRNFEKWDILNTWIWPNNFVGGSWENEILYLKSWIIQRIKWIDTALNYADLIYDHNKPERYNILKLFPNPTNGEINIQIKLSIIPENIDINVYNMLGQKVFSLNNVTVNDYVSTLTIPLSKFESNIFILEVKAGKLSLKKKFIILK